MAKILLKSIIQEEKLLVKVPSNSELEITRYQNVGTLLSNRCRKGKWQKCCVLIIWIREEVETISDKVVHHGLKKELTSRMNLKYTHALNNLLSQKMTQSFQGDASLLPLMVMEQHWLLVQLIQINMLQERLVCMMLVLQHGQVKGHKIKRKCGGMMTKTMLFTTMHMMILMLSYSKDTIRILLFIEI